MKTEEEEDIFVDQREKKKARQSVFTMEGRKLHSRDFRVNRQARDRGGSKQV